MPSLPRVDIAIPVYHGNLAEIEPSVTTQITFYQQQLKQYDWKIVIALNGKNPEKVIALAKQLRRRYRGRVDYTYCPQPGKGHGVITAWQNSDADIITYMDVDLATDLKHFPTLLSYIRHGYDLCTGSRYLPQSQIKRLFKRIVISRVYIRLFYRFVLGVPLTDAQCGYKAVNRRVVQELLPHVQDRVWFWESELLYYAHKKDYKIKEIPVHWIEDPNSGVNLMKIVPNFIKNVLRLRFSKLPR